MAFIGVRISWLMRARNTDLIRLASRAVCTWRWYHRTVTRPLAVTSMAARSWRPVRKARRILAEVMGWSLKSTPATATTFQSRSKMGA